MSKGGKENSVILIVPNVKYKIEPDGMIGETDGTKLSFTYTRTSKAPEIR